MAYGAAELERSLLSIPNGCIAFCWAPGTPVAVAAVAVVAAFDVVELLPCEPMTIVEGGGGGDDIFRTNCSALPHARRPVPACWATGATGATGGGGGGSIAVAAALLLFSVVDVCDGGSGGGGIACCWFCFCGGCAGLLPSLLPNLNILSKSMLLSASRLLSAFLSTSFAGPCFWFSVIDVMAGGGIVAVD